MEFRLDSRFNNRGMLRHFLEFRSNEKQQWQKIQSFKDMLNAQNNLEKLVYKRDQLDDAFTESIYKQY